MGAGFLATIFSLQYLRFIFLPRKKEPSFPSWWWGGERLGAGAIIGQRGQTPAGLPCDPVSNRRISYLKAVSVQNIGLLDKEVKNPGALVYNSLGYQFG